MKKIKIFKAPVVFLLLLMILGIGFPAEKAAAYSSNAAWARNQNQIQQLNQSQIQKMSEVQLRLLIQLLTQLRERLLQLQSQQDGSSDIEIATRTALDISDTEALLRGRVVDFGQSDFADVWFEYDTNRFRFDDVTVIERIEDSEDGYFERRVAGLDEDTVYYYRAVGEDEDEDVDYGSIVMFRTDDSDSDDDDDDDDSDNEPDTITRNAAIITDDSAELRGSVDMNDFENGEVFFVYGEDEDQVADVEDDYDSYSDVDEDGDDLQKVRVDTDLDSDDSYEEEVEDLDNDTRYYFSICVGYEDEDEDDVLLCGDTRSFTTDL